MSEKNIIVNNNKGLGISAILGIIFVVMKLAGIGAIANWSWFLVLLPFYWVLAVYILIWFFGMTIVGLIEAFEWLQKKIGGKK